MKRRAILAVTGVLALGAAAFFLFASREKPAPDADIGGAARSEPTPPGLAVAPFRVSNLPGSREPPTEVPPGGALLRVLSKETGQPLAGVRWWVWDWDLGLRTHEREEGVTGQEGTSILTAAALKLWSRGPMRTTGAGTRDGLHDLEAPREGAIELRLRLVVNYEGVVLDEIGRPIAGAELAVEGSTPRRGGPFRTTADAEGHFVLGGQAWYDEPELIKALVLFCGAPGRHPISMPLGKSGEKNISIRLEPDPDGGILEVTATWPDGSAVIGERLWVDDVPPKDREELRYSEIWREPTDKSSSGSATWVRVGERDVRQVALGWDGERTVYPVVPGRRRVQVWTDRGAADVTVDVLRPPGVTRLAVTVEPLRVVTGKIRVDRALDWACEHKRHFHSAHLEDWAADGEALGSWDGGEMLRLPVPASCPAFVVRTSEHESVRVALPARRPGETAPLDVGEVVVPSGRRVTCALDLEGGSQPKVFASARVEDRQGIVVETRDFTYPDHDRPGLAYCGLILPRRPGPEAWMVVRMRPAEEDGPTKEVRLDGPFDFVHGPLELVVPASK